jgi:hypothetical protein
MAQGVGEQTQTAAEVEQRCGTVAQRGDDAAVERIRAELLAYVVIRPAAAETALRQDGACEYVYILEDGCLREREVTVLMRGQGYVIVEEQTEGLSHNDVVITGGKNLYDGKYID